MTRKQATKRATAQATDDRITLTYEPLSKLTAAVRNAKLHAKDEISASYHRFGMASAVTVNDGTSRLVAGHGRVEVLLAQKAAGEEPPRRILSSPDGDWLVPTLHLTFDSDEEAEAYLLADNRLTMLGGFDDQILAPMLADALKATDGLIGIGYDDDDVAEVLARVGITTDDGGGDGDAGGGNGDRVPEPPKVPRTKDGDLWILGEHRLLCGNGLDTEVRARLLEGVGYADLVVTDPPFAIYGSSTGIGADVADDKMVRPFFEAMFHAIAASVREFAHVYVHCDWRSWAAIWDSAARARLSAKNAIVWDKGNSGLGSMYANGYELIGFFSRLPPPTAMKSTTRRGQRTVFSSNVVRHPRVSGDERQHNAAKPVALERDLIENSSDEGEVVLDLFGGSGTTLIAAEQTKRRAMVTELEPRWCDVIVARWEALTGRIATLAAATPAPARDPVAAAV